MVWKLAAIWDLFKDFNEKYQENFVIREFATVDKMFVIQRKLQFLRLYEE